MVTSISIALRCQSALHEIRKWRGSFRLEHQVDAYATSTCRKTVLLTYQKVLINHSYTLRKIPDMFGSVWSD